MIKSFEAKIGNMRKPQRFVTYPRKNKADLVTVQSDKTIGRFNPETGVGTVNFKGPHFVHLNAVLGAVPFTFPPDFVKAAVEAGAVSYDGTVKVVG